MKVLPVADPGTPDHRSATRYLLWVARNQVGTLVPAITFGIVYMVAPALSPAAIGKGVDALTARDGRGLVAWSAVLAALAAVQAVAGVMRHRFAVTNWLSGAYRTVQVTARHATHVGATLPKRVVSGEVVSIGTTDVDHIGHGMDIVARGSGSVVAIVVVTTVLLHASPRLGLVVLIGVPVLMAIVALLLRPLHRRQADHRELTGRLTGRAGDIVAGLRVLRGVGGEASFAARYRAESDRVRQAGVRVAKVDSVLEAAQVLLPGIFIALVTWIGARFALAGDITAGQLVAFYGYAAFLLLPMRTLVETANRLTRAHVAARRVVRLLRLTPEVASPARPVPPPPADGDLTDPVSGLVVRPGELTALAAADPADAVTIVDRLGRYDPASAARLSDVPLSDLAVRTVRELILVADNNAHLFRGRLRTQLGVGDVAAALQVASADDIVAALPDGVDTELAERGRDLSGGQQQRLRLARALLADPPILLLVEPTSAVDAHTEARIGDRLAAARRGRTTLVCTTSPLLLRSADRVAFVAGGRLVAEGTHADLLETSPGYAATVTRGEDS